MKVAVVGAGPAGLACALELERLGVKPVIYERQHRIGTPAETVGILLHTVYRPVKDQLAYLAEKCHLQIRPQAELRTMHMHSYNHHTAIRGHRMGYLLSRGRRPDSVERQLAARLHTPVIFETSADALTLRRHFDAVVAATGDSSVARALGLWQEYGNLFVRGAVVLGRFDPTAVHMFYDTRYAGHGFGYLSPFDRGRASLHLCAAGIQPGAMDDHWELFLEAEKLHFPQVETFELEFHTGRVTRHQHDNLFLVGGGGGFTSSLLGLGIFSGLISAVLAARAIVYGLDYEALVQPLARHIDRFNDLRLALDHLDNQGLDRLVGFLGLPGIKHLIYHSDFDVIRHAHRLITNLPWLKEEIQAKHISAGREPQQADNPEKTASSPVGVGPKEILPSPNCHCAPSTSAFDWPQTGSQHTTPPDGQPTLFPGAAGRHNAGGRRRTGRTTFSGATGIFKNGGHNTAPLSGRPTPFPGTAGDSIPPAAGPSARAWRYRLKRPARLIGTGTAKAPQEPKHSFKRPAMLIADKKPFPLEALPAQPVTGRLLSLPTSAQPAGGTPK